MNRILIIDDLKENLDIVGKILLEAGYDVKVAESGALGIDLCRVFEFDLLLIDVRMPEMDGFQTYKGIRSVSRCRQVPVLFFVAKTDYENVPKVFEVGGVDVISKPFQRDELLARVCSHVEIHQQRKQLMELNATKDRLLSILAHDLKNPFSALLGFSEMLLEEHEQMDVETRREQISWIYSASKNTYALLENLLTWVRSQFGGLKIELETLLLEDVVHETLADMQGHARKKGIRLHKSELGSFSVLADRNMLATVLRNLVSNAIKFTKSGGSVALSAHVASASGKLQVVVADSGVGISEKKMATLFEVTKNRSTRGTANETGTGLGLLLCREFIEKLNGQIWAVSEVDNGTELHFTIPLANKV